MLNDARARQAMRILVSRLVPGALNVIALLALAAWLPSEAYGLASTFIATSAAGADLLFGPIYQAALVHYSEHRARGDHKRFESVHIANTLLLAVAISAASAIFVLAGIVDWRIVAGMVAMGSYTSIQEISHARLQFYRFAIGSSSQSLLFLVLAFVMVRADPTVWSAVEAFAISYGFGALVSAILVKPRFAAPSMELLKGAFALGTVPTLSNLSVSAFALSCRYLMLLFGWASALGVFAFSLDIAQRGVGIFINLATFAIVPQALQKAEGTDARELWRSLARGWIGAVAVSLCGAAAIIALGATHLFGPLNRPVYDPLSFAIIALAVIINRSSKMVLNPVAMRLRQTRLLLTPLVLFAPVALAMVAVGLWLRIPYSVELGYFSVFAISSWFGYHALMGKLGKVQAA